MRLNAPWNKGELVGCRTKNLRAIQLPLGHSKLESTVRYLGIEVDDALEIAEQTEIQALGQVNGCRSGWSLNDPEQTLARHKKTLASAGSLSRNPIAGPTRLILWTFIPPQAAYLP